MSVADAIAPHIAYLRRFARALSGAQAAGDAYVAATLEAILEEPALIEAEPDPRVALYRTFLRAWRDVPVNNQAYLRSGHEEASALRTLGAIEREPRIAFLLSAVESFEVGEIAAVMECSEATARDCIDRAGRGIAEQLRTDVLIIEDEPLIALDLQSLIEQMGHRSSSIARTHTEAVQAALQGRPGLILADIQLADGSSGLDAVNEILLSQQVPVIFITAFPERFLTGRAPEPAFLITKPFSAESVKAVVSQALFFDTKSRRTTVEPSA